MKICPACSSMYNDDSMRFCTKDGTPLIVYEETKNTPPSVNPLDETLSDIPMPAHAQDDEPPTVVNRDESRFVVPLGSTPQQQTPPPMPPPIQAGVGAPPPGQPPTIPPQRPQPKRKSNGGLYAILGVLAFLGVLGLASGFGIYWYLSSNKEVAVANTNGGANSNNAANNNSANTDVNFPNLGNGNSVINANENANGNVNLNANARPSPSVKPSPSVSPSVNRNTNRNTNQNENTDDEPPPPPTPEPRETPTPRPSPTQPQGARTVAGGVVNGKATNLPRPPYPAAARAVRAEGQVNVQVLIDENGNVVSASAISGHPLLRQAATSAARQAKFSPTTLSGQPVKVSGVIIYNFTLQ